MLGKIDIYLTVNLICNKKNVLNFFHMQVGRMISFWTTSLVNM